MHSKLTQRKSDGFTLIELVTALGVLSIIISLAMPSFRSLQQNGRRAAAINELLVTLTHARSEAITQRRNVVVCRSTTATSASPTCGTGTGWESGWVSFVDADGDDTFDSTETILRRHEPLTGGITARGDAGASSLVRFNSSGLAAANGKIAYCDGRGWGVDARIMNIALGGRVQTLQTGQDADPKLSSCL